MFPLCCNGFNSLVEVKNNFSLQAVLMGVGGICFLFSGASPPPSHFPQPQGLPEWELHLTFSPAPWTRRGSHHASGKVRVLSHTTLGGSRHGTAPSATSLALGHELEVKHGGETRLHPCCATLAFSRLTPNPGSRRAPGALQVPSSHHHNLLQLFSVPATMEK